MQIDRALCFWLGDLDTRVARGGETGGTRDIRLCKRAAEVERFIDSPMPPGSRHELPLEPYVEEDLPAYNLPIVVWGGRRSGEVALSAQHGASRHPYPLWKRRARPWRGGKPRDAIVLLRDSSNRYHARILRRENMENAPDWLRTELKKLDECARFASVPGGAELVDLPVPKTEIGDTFLIVPPSLPDRVAELAALAGPGGKEPAGMRHRRSRLLVAKLKSLYSYRCQLCGDGPDALPRIDMGGGRFYVEVHHVDGLSETEEEPDPGAGTDEGRLLSLDSARHAVVVCPHHHCVLHHAHGGYRYVRADKRFVGQAGGGVLVLRINHHL